MKNYYRILGVARTATGGEIRNVYRKLAFRYHPDRNPGNRLAEERFKEIAEAYGVLMDRRKRDLLDRHFGKRTARTSPSSAGGKGFNYAREDIFRDMFGNPDTRNFFSELEREFRKKGYRFDEAFFNEIFFRKKGAFFGGELVRIGGEAQYSSFRPSDGAGAARRGRRAEDTEAPAAGSLSFFFRLAGRILRKWRKTLTRFGK